MSLNMFSFALLDPRPIPAAAEANEKLFAFGPVCGIEVTVPALAARCIANLDPQHSGGNAERAAIEAALEVELPPDGVTLATVRADLDAVGAMAVFASRAGNSKFPGAAMDRIRLVAESDKFARGGWPGPKPLPTLDNLELGAEMESRLAAIARAIGDFKIPLMKRVRWMQLWLHTGAEPEGYREQYLAEQRDLASALANGQIKASRVWRKLCPACGEVEWDSDMYWYGPLGPYHCMFCRADRAEWFNPVIAVVVSSHRAATSVGYSLAPVVVAFNPAFKLGGGEPHAKFTVCQFTGGYVDLKAAAAELSELESGWGGSPTIIGSPQGVGSRLTTDEVVSVVKKHIRS